MLDNFIRLNDDDYKSIVWNLDWISSGKKCYVKVKVFGIRLVFKVESYKVNKNDFYGYSIDIIRLIVDNFLVLVICFEYRCSDVLLNGVFFENIFIKIRLVLGNCKFVNIVSNFDFY